MHRVRLAELVLSVVMARECAAATAGDLAESHRGPLKFWISLIRIFFGAIFGQLNAPLLVKSIGFALLLGFVGRLIATGITQESFSLFFEYPRNMYRLPEYNLVVFVNSVTPVLHAFWPVVIGYWVARRNAGRELAAWTCIAAFAIVCSLSWGFAPAVGRTMLRLFLSPEHLLAILAGILLMRWVRLRRERVLA